MTDLARLQAELVAALTGTAPMPSDFDVRRLDIARKALLRKRSGEVAKQWPMLRSGLADRFATDFAGWAEHRPTGGAWRDGWDFALALEDRSELPESALAELVTRRLLWRYDGRSAPRRRRLPAAAWVNRRLLVQVAGRVTVLGR